MKKKKVLIIEDDWSLCSLLENILKPTYDVTAVQNCVEAWSWLMNGNCPALIISDFKLPRINGLELAENLKSSGIFRGIPIFIISGKNEPNLKERCEKQGVNAFFKKPFSPVILVSAIKEILTTENHVDA